MYPQVSDPDDRLGLSQSQVVTTVTARKMGDAALLSKLERKGFQVEFHSHAKAILQVDFPAALQELQRALLDLAIPIEEIIGSGGGEAKGTQRLRRSLSELGWTKVSFEIKKIINGVTRESVSHEVDHVRSITVDGAQRQIGLEIEWNNKDPFFDRDLENFKRLHAEGAISVGVIITRGESLQANLKGMVKRFAETMKIGSFDDLVPFGLSPTPRQKRAVISRVGRKSHGLSFADSWAEHFVSDKFGAATTHWRKLADRVHRGVGNPCPLLLIGLPATVVTFDRD